MKKFTATSLERKKLQKRALLLILFGALVLCSTSTLADYTQGLLSKDSIYIPNQSYKATGDNNRGKLLHTFRIYNLRPRFLSIEAQPDCGCTGVSWRKTRIPPFTWRNLTAEMRVTSTTQQSATVALHTNDTNQKWKFLFLSNQ